MYYLYNPKTLMYIGRKKSNHFYATRDFRQAYLFDNIFAPQNILNSGGLRKDIPGRDGFIIKEETSKTEQLTKPYCPTEQEINDSALFSFDELEKEIKKNETKIKICCTFLENVYKSVESMEKIVELLDNKIVLIYHVIESGKIKTEEDKRKIYELLNRTLTLRRKVKKQRAVYASIKTGRLLDDIHCLRNKINPFGYWDYNSLEEFISIIENGEKIIKHPNDM